MSVNKRLSQVFENSPEITIDESSKFIIFSDIHRGDNTWADDFSHNQQIYFHALKLYFDLGFTYIELGDGDELWENKSFAAIRQQQSHIFWIMREFYRDNRLYMILGNHDMSKKSANFLESFYDERTRRNKPLFPGIELYEGLIMVHTDMRLLLVHGHQGDFWSDRMWRFSQFWVRNCWKKLQTFGMKYPATPAKNYKHRLQVEQKVLAWIRQNGQPLIMGHTHRPSFPQKGDLPYFNSGSCIHPRCITGIEILGFKISLIKWSIEPDEQGKLTIVKTILAGPEDLHTFF